MQLKQLVQRNEAYLENLKDMKLPVRPFQTLLSNPMERAGAML